MLGSHWDVLECIFHVSLNNNKVSARVDDQLQNFLEACVPHLANAIRNVVIHRLAMRVWEVVDSSPAPVMFRTKPKGEQIHRWLGRCTGVTRLEVRSSWSLFSMIVGSSRADARLSESMKASGPSYPNSAPNRRTIGWWIHRLLGYQASRSTYALGFSGEGELVSGGLEASTSLNLMILFGLEGAGRHG